MQTRPRVVIVGGGISGLATAHYIQSRLGDDVQLTVIEAGPKLGGKVSTEEFGGHLVDVGPDALLVRVPAMAALLKDLGFGDQLVAPSTLGAFIWSRSRLRRIPTGTMFGVPDRLVSLLKSRLLSPTGLARAAMDLVLPRRRVSDDPSIADLVAPRLGSQVFDRLVEPLLGGVHAGRATELSARSTVPEIAALATKNRSLYLGLLGLRRHAKPKSGGPVLVTLAGGLGRLVEALTERLKDADLRVNSVVRLIASEGDDYRVELADGASISADAVVLATPAFASAQLLADMAPEMAAVLGEVPFVDVATIWLAYPRSTMGRPLDGTGFLVPPEENKFLVGCTWSGAKWPHLADDDIVLIRGMVGRRGDTRWMSMDDETMVRRVHEELVESMGLTGGPVDQSVQRWPQAMPQYLVGHAGRLAALDARLTHLPRLYLTGASYRGVGIASCVADAERKAQDVACDVSQPQADVRPLTEVTS
ncbi:MAG: protoporphyrinogen oxidase [Dermatophilaceae bacterium]